SGIWRRSVPVSWQDGRTTRDRRGAPGPHAPPRATRDGSPDDMVLPRRRIGRPKERPAYALQPDPSRRDVRDLTGHAAGMERHRNPKRTWSVDATRSPEGPLPLSAAGGH